MEKVIETGRWLGDENSEDEGSENHQNNIGRAVEQLEKEGCEIKEINTNWFAHSVFPHSCISVTRITYDKS